MEAHLDETFSAAVDAKRVPGIAVRVLDRSGAVVYSRTFGTVNLGDPGSAPLTSTTRMRIYSLTKLVTSVAALQLLEEGKLRLEDPVEKYVPAIRDIPVLDGFAREGGEGGGEGEGEPIFRPPRTKPTILHLMTHTSGFTYGFFHENTRQWRKWETDRQKRLGIEPQPGPTRSLFESPLAFDPGEGFAYGVSTDWLGFVVEAVSGKSLDKFIESHILKPLGMNDSGSLVPQMTLHHRSVDGQLIVGPPRASSGAADAEKVPDMCPGGEYLVSTLEDFSKFLLTILNEGFDADSGTRILKPETVREYLFTDQMPRILGSLDASKARAAQQIGVVRSVNSDLSVDGEFLAGISKGWSCGFMLKTEEGPPGRRGGGSGSWAGLANLYYWVDPENGKLALVMTDLFPFMDKEVLMLVDELEAAIYA